MPIAFATIVPPDLDAAATNTSGAVANISEGIDAARPEMAVLINGQGGAVRQAIGIAPAEHALLEQVAAETPRDSPPIAKELHAERPPITSYLGVSLPSIDAITITVSALSLRFHFDFGRALGRALAVNERRAVIVCTATLSAAADTRRARQFDSHYRNAIEGWDVKWLTHVESSYRHDAAEDCLAQTAVLMGALSNRRIQPRVLSYEAPAGTGLLVAAIEILGPRQSRKDGSEAEAR